VLRLIETLQQQHKQQINNITQQLSRDVCEVCQQIHHLNQQVNTLEQTARETVNTLDHDFNQQMQHIHEQLATDTSDVQHQKQPLLQQPLLSRPQTVQLQPPPGFTTRYVNVPATFSVPQYTATQTSETKQTTTMAQIAAKHTIPVKPSAQPHSSQIRKRKSPSDTTPKQHKQQRTSNTAFISDSTMKFLTEDKTTTLPYLIRQDMENNIRLYRGKSAQEILQRTNFKQLKANGVANIVASFGTVDLLNMHHNQQTPEEVATALANSVNDFVNTAAFDRMETLYIIPGYNKKLTQTEFEQFQHSIQQQLEADMIKYIKLSDIMTDVAGPTITGYNNIIEDVLIDGIHLHNQTGQALLQTALSHFNITCNLTQSNISSTETLTIRMLHMR